MRRSRWRAAILLFALLVIPRSVRAENERVALAVADRDLAESLRMTLSPLGLDVVSVNEDIERLRAQYGDAALRATADSHRAVAVVWIERFGSAYLLSSYSTRSGQTKSRPLRDAPPYDDAAAAAVAFSVKTLLREGAVIATPAHGKKPSEEEQEDELAEKIGAGPGEGSEVAEVAAGDAAASLAEVPTEVPAKGATSADAQRVGVANQPALATRSWLWLEVGGARQLAQEGSDPAAQVRGVATYWPAAAANRLGASLSIVRSAAVEITHDSLNTDFSATEVGLGARLRLPFAHRFAVIPGAGVALRLTRLGRLSAENGGASPAHRSSAVAEGEITLAAFLAPRIALAISFYAGVYMGPVQYTWEGQPIFEEPWTRASAGAQLLLAF